MPTRKLIWMSLLWLLASVMIAVVTAIVAVELLRLLGAVESGAQSYTVALNVVFAIVFVVLVLVPFVFRDRFTIRDPDDG